MFETIKSHMDFKKVYSSGDSLANRHLVLYFLKRYDQTLGSRYGITVSKKVGNAVVRNKVRRRIREIIRSKEKELKSGYDVVIVSRVRAKEASFDELDAAFCSLVKKSSLLIAESEE